MGWAVDQAGARVGAAQLCRRRPLRRRGCGGLTKRTTPRPPCLRTSPSRRATSPGSAPVGWTSPRSPGWRTRSWTGTAQPQRTPRGPPEDPPRAPRGPPEDSIPGVPESGEVRDDAAPAPPSGFSGQETDTPVIAEHPLSALAPPAVPASSLLDPLQAAAATPEQATAAAPPHRATAQRSRATTTAQEPPPQWPWPAQRGVVGTPQYSDRVYELRLSWRRTGRPDRWLEYVTAQFRRGVGLDPRRHDAAFLRGFLDWVAPDAQAPLRHRRPRLPRREWAPPTRP